jgi:hypothetical protein
MKTDKSFLILEGGDTMTGNHSIVASGNKLDVTTGSEDIPVILNFGRNRPTLYIVFNIPQKWPLLLHH